MLLPSEKAPWRDDEAPETPDPYGNGRPVIALSAFPDGVLPDAL